MGTREPWSFPGQLKGGGGGRGGMAGGAGREAKDQKIVSGRPGEEPKMYRPDLNTSETYSAPLYIWASLPAVCLVL